MVEKYRDCCYVLKTLEREKSEIIEKKRREGVKKGKRKNSRRKRTLMMGREERGIVLSLAIPSSIQLFKKLQKIYIATKSKLLGSLFILIGEREKKKANE